MREPGLLQVTVCLSVWLKPRVKQEERQEVSELEPRKQDEVTLQKDNEEPQGLDSGVRLPALTIDFTTYQSCDYI